MPVPFLDAWNTKTTRYGAMKIARSSFNRGAYVLAAKPVVSMFMSCSSFNDYRHCQIMFSQSSVSLFCEILL